MHQKDKTRKRPIGRPRDDSKLPIVKKPKKNNKNKSSRLNGSGRYKMLIYLAIALLILVCLVIPLAFRYSWMIRRLCVFMNYVNVETFKDLSMPSEDFGLNCTRVVHFQVNDQIKVGAWHVLPKSRLTQCPDVSQLDEEEALKDDRPVILYLHGNGGARGGSHRVELYHVLTGDVDAHVVTIDYRGYGDSTNVWPSAEGITEDAASVYKRLLSKVGARRLVVWGHSLGTAVTTRFVSRLQQEEAPKAVVLEAPFTTISETVSYHPLATFHSKLPYFDWFFVDPLVQEEQVYFDSLSMIGKVQSPLLILHALDDGIVPFHLGKKLYETALKERPKHFGKVQMVAFSANGYGHKHICRDPELPKIVADFIKSS